LAELARRESSCGHALRYGDGQQVDGNRQEIAFIHSNCPSPLRFDDGPIAGALLRSSGPDYLMRRRSDTSWRR